MFDFFTLNAFVFYSVGQSSKRYHFHFISDLCVYVLFRYMVTQKSIYAQSFQNWFNKWTMSTTITYNNGIRVTQHINPSMSVKKNAKQLFWIRFPLKNVLYLYQCNVFNIGLFQINFSTSSTRECSNSQTHKRKSFKLLFFYQTYTFFYTWICKRFFFGNKNLEYRTNHIQMIVNVRSICFILFSEIIQWSVSMNI